MRNDSVIKHEGFNALINKLDIVEVERFITILNRERFDYTEWRKTLWEDLSVEELKELISEAVAEELERHFSVSSHQDELISRREAAQLFKVTLVTIDKWRQKGTLKSYKIGGRLLFKRSELEEALRNIDY